MLGEVTVATGVFVALVRVTTDPGVWPPPSFTSGVLPSDAPGEVTVATDVFVALVRITTDSGVWPPPSFTSAVLL